MPRVSIPQYKSQRSKLWRSRASTDRILSVGGSRHLIKWRALTLHRRAKPSTTPALLANTLGGCGKIWATPFRIARHSALRLAPYRGQSVDRALNAGGV